MPLPMERDCVKSVVQFVLDAGGVIAQAQQPISTWDQDRVTKMDQGLVAIGHECELMEGCLESAFGLYGELGNILGRGEFKPIAEQVNDLEATMRKFLDCLFGAYALQTRQFEDYQVSLEEWEANKPWLKMDPETGDFDRPTRVGVR